MTLPLAHAGHWLADLLYVLPVLVVVGWIAVRALMDRRSGGGGGRADADG